MDCGLEFEDGELESEVVVGSCDPSPTGLKADSIPPDANATCLLIDHVITQLDHMMY